MDERLYLVKEGEIALKGGNRIMFERKLRGNIRSKLKPYQSRMDKSKGRVYVSVEDSCPREQAEKALSTTFGITGWAESERCREKSMEAIMEKTEETSPFLLIPMLWPVPWLTLLRNITHP